MGSMVRNIPDEVLQGLKDIARSRGTSAEQIAREALAARAQTARRTDLTREEAWAGVDAIRAKSKPIDQETYDRIMREAREERDGPLYYPVADHDY